MDFWIMYGLNHCIHYEPVDEWRIHDDHEGPFGADPLEGLKGRQTYDIPEPFEAYAAKDEA